MYVEGLNEPDVSYVEKHTQLVTEGLSSATSIYEVIHEGDTKLV